MAEKAETGTLTSQALNNAMTAYDLKMLALEVGDTNLKKRKSDPLVCYYSQMFLSKFQCRK